MYNLQRKKNGFYNDIRDKILPGYIIKILSSKRQGKPWKNESELSERWIQRYTLGDETEKLVTKLLNEVFYLTTLVSERLSPCDEEGIDIIIPQQRLVFQVKSSPAGIQTFKNKEYTLKKFIIPIWVHPYKPESKRALYLHLKEMFKPLNILPSGPALRIEKLKQARLLSPNLIGLANIMGFHNEECIPYLTKRESHSNQSTIELQRNQPTNSHTIDKLSLSSK